jgi:hypothetical protein
MSLEIQHRAIRELPAYNDVSEPGRRPSRKGRSRREGGRQLAFRRWLPDSRTGTEENGLVLFEPGFVDHSKDYYRTSKLATLAAAGLKRVMELARIRVGKASDGRVFHSYPGGEAFAAAFNQLPTPGLPEGTRPLEVAPRRSWQPYYLGGKFVRYLANRQVPISTGVLARQFFFEAHDINDHGPVLAIIRNSAELTEPLVDSAERARDAYDVSIKPWQVGRWLGAIASGQWASARDQRRQAIAQAGQVLGAFDALFDVQVFEAAYKTVDPALEEFVTLDAPDPWILGCSKDHIEHLYGPNTLDFFIGAVKSSVDSYATLGPDSTPSTLTQ